MVGGELTQARGVVNTAYGKLTSEWWITDGKFTLHVDIPCSTTAIVKLPGGKEVTLGSGSYTLEEKM